MIGSVTTSSTRTITFSAIPFATSLTSLNDAGTRFEHERYDVSHLYNLAHFVDRGLVRPPFFVQMIFGVLGGHVGVGLEDSLFIERGVLATSNAQQVAKIVRILAEMGHEPATT